MPAAHLTYLQSLGEKTEFKLKQSWDSACLGGGEDCWEFTVLYVQSVLPSIIIKYFPQTNTFSVKFLLFSWDISRRGRGAGLSPDQRNQGAPRTRIVLSDNQIESQNWTHLYTFRLNLCHRICQISTSECNATQNLLWLKKKNGCEKTLGGRLEQRWFVINCKELNQILDVWDDLCPLYTVLVQLSGRQDQWGGDSLISISVRRPLVTGLWCISPLLSWLGS